MNPQDDPGAPAVSHRIELPPLVGAPAPPPLIPVVSAPDAAPWEEPDVPNDVVVNNASIRLVGPYTDQLRQGASMRRSTAYRNSNLPPLAANMSPEERRRAEERRIIELDLYNDLTREDVHVRSKIMLETFVNLAWTIAFTLIFYIQLNDETRDYYYGFRRSQKNLSGIYYFIHLNMWFYCFQITINAYFFLRFFFLRKFRRPNQWVKYINVVTLEDFLKIFFFIFGATVYWNGKIQAKAKYDPKTWHHISILVQYMVIHRTVSAGLSIFTYGLYTLCCRSNQEGQQNDPQIFPENGPGIRKKETMADILRNKVREAKIGDMDEDENCAICMEEFDVKDTEKQIAELNCKHIFHANCLNAWIQKNKNCPMCREIIQN